MKKCFILFSIMLLVPMLFSCENIKMVYNDTFNVYTWDDGKLIIKGFNYNKDTRNVFIGDTLPIRKSESGEIYRKPVYFIDHEAFQNNFILTSFIIENDNNFFNAIYFRAFANCVNLTVVKFPNSLSIIDTGAFTNCVNLKEIELNGLVTLENIAFGGCSKLKKVTFGQKITKIGSYAFLNCSDNLEIYLTAENPPSLGFNVFYGVNSFKIYVPEELVNVYKSHSDWKEFADNIYNYN